MGFADDLRNQTVTDQQRELEWRKQVLAGKDKYVESFRYACRQAAQLGKNSCTLVFAGNYDDNIHDFYIDHYDTAEEIRRYVEESLRQDGFKKLKTSVERLEGCQTIQRALMKGLFGPYKYKKKLSYTLRVEAKW